MPKVVIGFCVSCSSKTSPGLDGKDPAFVSLSLHFPDMGYILEVVTKLDARSKAKNSKELGEDTDKVAAKIGAEIDKATKAGLLSKANRKKIKVQHDGGEPGCIHGRIVLDGVDHVNFGTKDDGGKIRWHAIIVDKGPSAKGGYYVRYIGSGCDNWNRRQWNQRLGKPVKPGKIKVKAKVPHPKGYKPNNNKFKDGKKASKTGEVGQYVNEATKWVKAK